MLRIRDIELLRDVRAVSSGTMASLSGLRKYEDIERLELAFHEWLRGRLEAEPSCFMDWREAWRAFAAEFEWSEDGTVTRLGLEGGAK